jgi:hypothetical protein
MKPVVFCITGWHFPIDFYQQITSLSEVDVYIVSHKGNRNIPDFISELFPQDRILIQPNIGYDWGCYQQFIESGLWKDYELVFFMHDDIQIHDFGFIDQVALLLKSFRVIGNGKGKGTVGKSSLRSHPYAYAHSTWKPNSFDFSHPTVRGSFFAISSRELSNLGGFEVYWDPFKIFIGFGNWSTKASCGKMAGYFGEDSFGYLSNEFGMSEYVTEFVRGEQGGALSEPEGIKGWLYSTIKRFSRVYLELLYKEKELTPRSFWLTILRLGVKGFSSKLI